MSEPQQEQVTVTPGDFKPVKPYTLWSPAQFLGWEPPAEPGVLMNGAGEPFFEKGTVAGIVGPPGVGKTRLALNLAVAALTGGAWCGLRTADPGTVVMLSNENGRRRWRNDLRRILGTLTAEGAARVEEGLRIQCTGGAGDLDLDWKRNAVQWRATLALARPGLLVVDPFEAACGGDANDSRAVRETIDGARATLTATSGDESTLVFVHHGRTGSGNHAQAVGYDAGNFAKGSKTFTSMARAVVNVAPADPENAGARVVVAPGKCNDCAPFDARAADLDPQSMTYTVDTGFDLRAWKADLEGKRGGKECAIADVVESVKRGNHKARDIKRDLRDALGASDRTVARRLSDAVVSGYLITCTRGTYTLPPPKA